MTNGVFNLPTWICSCQSVGTVNFALPFTTNVTISISILQTFRSWVATSHLRPPMAFLSHNSSDTPGLAPLMNVFFLRAMRLSNKLLGQGYVKGTFEIVSKEVLWSVRGSYQTIWGPPLPNVTRHSGWWPNTVTPSIDRTLHQFLTITDLDLITEFDFLPIVQGFHGTYATGAACEQRTLTPPDTWSCPTLGFACVLMSRPISPELVLSPDFWISNTPRYFSFA